MTAYDDEDRPRTWSELLPITVSVMPDRFARKLVQETMTFHHFAQRLRSTSALTKETLPLGKMACFGDRRSDPPGRSLRHDGNVVAITGVEGDYDGGTMPVEEAVAIADGAGLLSIITTSPSYTEYAPRWRIWCPTSRQLPPAERYALMSMINGLFGGIFAVESWTLSQAFYLGSPLVNGGRNPLHQVFEIEGTPIDRKPELIAGAIDKPGTQARDDDDGLAGEGRAAVDETALLLQVISGESMHPAAIRLIGKWMHERIGWAEAEARLTAAFDSCAEAVRKTKRWKMRRAEIPELLEFVLGKEARKAHERAHPEEPPPAEEDPTDPLAGLRRRLHTAGKKRAVVGSLRNAALILQHDPVVAGLAQRNRFTNALLLMHEVPAIESTLVLPGPYPRELTDADISKLAIWLQDAWGRGFVSGVALEALTLAAAGASFHPVCDWLDQLAWDGVARLDRWLSEVFGCPADGYHMAVGAKVLIAACRRVRQPGCKFDYVLVLEGGEGIGKSTAVKALFGEAWWTDNLPLDLSNKDAQQSLAGVWGVELSEIGHLLRNGHEVTKAFLSRSIDRYRPSYGRATVAVPRQCVMIGTTNRDDYLSDPSGNRRYWPVRCLLGGANSQPFADLDWLTQHRAQLWAEAAHREAQGETIFLDDPAVAAAAVVQQQARMQTEAMAGAIMAYARDRLPLPVSVNLILTNVLTKPTGLPKRADEMRVGDILREEGWCRRRLTVSGVRDYWWFPDAAAAAGYR